MAGRATIIIQGTAWGVRETQNGKRYLSVSVSPDYRDRNGNWVSQPEQYYSVWPAGYANLNPVFDQIAQLRQNQDQFVDVTIVGEISGLDAYTNKKGEPAASCNVNASAVAITNVRQKNGGQQGYGAQGALHVAASGLRPVGQRRQRPRVLTILHLYHDETPPDVEPVCERHGCPLYPARPIPRPECALEADEMYADYGLER